MGVAFPELVIIYPVVRVELYSLLERVDGLHDVAAAHVHVPEPAVEFIRVGCQRESTAQLSDCFCVLTCCAVDAAEERMDLRQLVVQLLSLLGCGKRLLSP